MAVGGAGQGRCPRGGAPYGAWEDQLDRGEGRREDLPKEGRDTGKHPEKELSDHLGESGRGT